MRAEEEASVPGRVDRSAGGGSAVMVLLVLMYALALTLCVTLAVKGHYELGVCGAALVLMLAPIAFMLARHGQSPAQQRTMAKLDEIARTVRMLADQSLLSDDARRVLNRQNERDLLVRAIEEDIARENWDAAVILISELADRFGFRADAEAMRQRVEQARKQNRERDITDAIGYLDGLILQRRWDDASADAARIQRLFPDSPRVEPLRDRVQAARASYKSDLERRFLVAAQEERADEALGLLKELDSYLTAAEAEPLREVARGVIGKARGNLGAEFKLALQDRRWAEAARIGESIIGQFPNSRMADEVRAVLDGVRAKANGAA